VVLASELTGRGLKVARQVAVPIIYKGISLDEGFRADLIIEDKVILELKSVEHVSPAHKKQVQTYLKLTGCKLGYLLNFGEAVLRTGITRCVNGLEENLLCASASGSCRTGEKNRFPAASLYVEDIRQIQELLVQGTQTRATPEAGISSSLTIPTFPYSSIPACHTVALA
jgi:GxxExxY protein